MFTLFADASPYGRLARIMSRLPMDMRRKVFSRAMRRTTQTGLSRVVKRSAERIDVPQKKVRALTRSYVAGDGDGEIVVRSKWIPLHDLGASQTASGVTVKLRGHYKSAFLAAMKSGHEGVFRRDGSKRLPISELFGPNPANEIGNNPDVYLDVLNDVIEDVFLPRALHELSRLLPST